MEASKLFSVEGMVFVVTGGGSGILFADKIRLRFVMLTPLGIGEMMARSLDANGAAKVYIVGRRMEKLHAVAAQAKRQSIVAVQGDITLKEDLESIARRVELEAGFVNGEHFSISTGNTAERQLQL